MIETVLEGVFLSIFDDMDTSLNFNDYITKFQVKNALAHHDLLVIISKKRALCLLRNKTCNALILLKDHDTVAATMQLFFYFVLFFLAHSIVQSYMFWIAKQTPKMSLLNYEFSHIWTFWIAALCVATPFLSIANFTFGATFHYGYKNYQTAWIVLLTYVAAQTLAYPAMVYLWFGELPHKGALVGTTLAIIGVFIANFWKN